MNDIISYVVDTNVFLSDGSFLKKGINANTIYIPLGVLKELDKHKSTPGEVGLNARKTLRILDEARDLGSLLDGVQMPEGFELKVVKGQDDLQVDDQVIQIAKAIQSTVLSNDINLRVRADGEGVKADKYRSNLVVETDDDIYSGLHTAYISSSDIDGIIAGIPEASSGLQKLNHNEFVLLKSLDNDKHTLLCRMGSDGVVRKITTYRNVFGLSSRNIEQACALDVLLDDRVPLVTMMGKAGSGKTLLALGAALHMTLEQRSYERILVIRPPIPMGKDIGFLPGTLEEKMSAWSHPILDSLDFLAHAGGKKFDVDSLMHSGQLSIEPPTFIRGRTLANCVVLIDEAQGLSQHEVKSLVTRLGSNSKLIITGDVAQIDSPGLSAVDNGFSHLVDKFKTEPLSAHIKLTKCERSDLAARAAEIL